MEVKTDLAPKAIGPYSQAILTDNILFISGQIPLKDGVLVSDYADACHIVMQNISHILHEAGFDYSNIVKTTIFIKDLSYFTVVNEVYESYLSRPFPARSCVEVSKMPKDSVLEIECIAMKR